jgi:hypothetical protein
MTISDADESKAHVIYFQNRYISTGFEFGDKQIIISDPEKNLDLLLRRRTLEDVPPNEKSMEAGDGFVTVTCKSVSAGEERSHYGRFRPEPVVHPGEPPVDGDAVRTLHSF